MNSFQLIGLSHLPFQHLFAYSDQQLREIGAIRRIATENPGFPCRISLQDAEVGEELLLLPYLHQPAESPYRASGPIFIRSNVEQGILRVGEVPEYVTRRQISLRAYDAAHMMIAAEVCAGMVVGEQITRQFADSNVAYIHLHNAKQGCFACQVKRV